MDSLYFTKIGIVIFTFEEMGMEVFVKNRSFQMKQHNSIVQARFDHCIL